MDLIILGRDGVINQGSDAHVRTPEQWIPIPGSLEAIARLNQAGYRVVVATNQSGLGRGLLDVEALNRIHEKMRAALVDLGGTIDAIFFCPHRPKDGCECRKPKPGMLLEIGSRLRVPLDRVPAVGDSPRDLEAARAAGARPVLVRTGKGRLTLERGEAPANVPVYDDLAAATDALIAQRD